MVSDLNPAAQGSSLTEGKRAKRSKKQEGVNGAGQNGDDEVDCEIEAPGKKADAVCRVFVKRANKVRAPRYYCKGA